MNEKVEWEFIPKIVYSKRYNEYGNMIITVNDQRKVPDNGYPVQFGGYFPILNLNVYYDKKGALWSYHGNNEPVMIRKPKLMPKAYTLPIFFYSTLFDENDEGKKIIVGTQIGYKTTVIEDNGKKSYPIISINITKDGISGTIVENEEVVAKLLTASMNAALFKGEE